MLPGPEVRANRTVCFTRADLANGEYQVDFGQAITVHETYWEWLKAGR
jgi:hypothetical protein